MGWVYKYYTEGHITVSNTHLYPYTYAPTGTSIKNFLKKMYNNYENLFHELEKLHQIYSESFEITPNHQLMMVLPPGSIDIIPYKLRDIYSKYMTALNPKKFLIIKEGTSKEWHKTPLIPSVNLDFTRMIFDNV